MRILVVTSEWPTVEDPTAVPFIVQQVDALRACGHVVEVWSFRGRKRLRSYVRARRTVAKILRGDRFDLVHAHFGQSGFVVPRAAPPLVVTYHGNDLFGIVGRHGRYTVRGFVQRLVSHHIARRADAVIAISKRLADRLPRGVRAVVIPDPVDLDRFRPIEKSDARERLGVPDDDVLVLFGGRPSYPVKRVVLAQDVVSRIPRARLITVERESHADVATWMNACDALLVTSRHEGGPLMAKEALAVNVPVVTVDVGDVREYAGCVDGCAVVGDDDPDRIADALRAVLDRRERVRGREAVADLSPDRIADRLVEVYRSVLGTTMSA